MRHPRSSARIGGLSNFRLPGPWFCPGWTCATMRPALTLAALQHDRCARLEQPNCRGFTFRFNAIVKVDCPPTESRTMNALLSSYLPIVIFIGVALAVGLALLVAPF